MVDAALEYRGECQRCRWHTMPSMGRRDGRSSSFYVDGKRRRFYCPNCDPAGTQEREARKEGT